MKTLKLFSLIACMILCGLTANAQTKVLQTPDEAEYFIKGDLNISKGSNGAPEYTLKNVYTKGINFKMQDVFKGKVTDKEDVAFTFEDASTSYNGGFENNVLQYWRFDEFEKVWIPESEVRQGEQDIVSNKYMNVVLVVDCSSSLGEDFESVKSNTLYFVNQLFNASPEGNIRLGIIGFSSIKETKVYDIKPLNSSTKSDVEYFVNRLEKGNGTALYYSMDKALEMLETDSKLIKIDEYLGSYLITFTDGIDQQSQNHDKDIFVAEDYYNYLRPILRETNTRKRIHGKNIETHIISVKGKDITSDRLEMKFDSDLKGICDYYEKMDNIGKLREKFNQLSKRLIDRNLQLVCYVPMAFKGKVGWTFKSIKQEPVVEPEPVVEYKPLPVKKDKMFLGVNLGIGIDAEGGFDLTVGADVAFPINKTLNLGGYAYFGITGLGVGGLAVIDFKNESSIVGGLGLAVSDYYSWAGVEFKAGYKFANGIYLTNTFSTTGVVLFNFGYDFGRFL